MIINDLIHFFIQHWLLSAAFVILLIAIIYVESQGSLIKGVKKINSQEAVLLINRDNALVIDTRDKNAFLSGHIVNALNIPTTEVATHKKVVDHKNSPIILVCANGTQSAALAANLAKQNFTAVYYLAGGVAGWRADNLPVVK